MNIYYINSIIFRKILNKQKIFNSYYLYKYEWKNRIIKIHIRICIIFVYFVNHISINLIYILQFKYNKK